MKSSSNILKLRNGGFVFFSVLISIVLTHSRAAGQVPPGMNVSPNETVPFFSSFDCNDAPNILISPGAFGFLEGFQIGGLTYRPSDSVSSSAFFLASSLFDRFKLGGAIHSVRLSDLPDYRRYMLGIGIPVSSSSAVGLTYASFKSTEKDLDGASSWSAGLNLRPARFLSVSASVENFNAPDVGPVEMPRRWLAGGGLRPFGRFLTIGADIRFFSRNVDGLERVEPFYYAKLEPVDGVTLSLSASGGPNVMLSLGVGGSRSDVFLSATSTEGAGGDRNLGYAAAAIVGTTEKHSVLTRRMNVAVIELSGSYPYADDGIFSTRPTWLELLGLLRQAAGDESLDGVVVQIDSLDVGWARANELREEIGRIRESGKFVASYLFGGGDIEYFIATQADRILAYPAASLEINGIALRAMFLSSGLEKAGLNAQFAKVGKYKSSPETLTSSSMSEEHGETLRSIAADLFDLYSSEVAASGRPGLQNCMSIGIMTGYDAAAAGVVDEAVSFTKVEEAIERHFNSPVSLDNRYEMKERKTLEWGKVPKIAVIYVDGIITPGGSVSFPFGLGSLSGARTVIRAIEEAAKDTEIAAVVLRIDSPGGSVLGSDEIWEEVMRVRDRKPVVASLGDEAASGGYYVASAADAVIAEPGTITGSIGVFAGKISAAGLLRLVGVNTETVKIGEHADMFGADRPFTEKEMADLQSFVDSSYRRFLKAVARGRRMSEQQVDAAGKGRVWTGRQAIEKGLIDGYGGFLDAVDEAKLRAGLSEDARVEIVTMPSTGVIETLLAGNSDDASAAGLPGIVPAVVMELLAGFAHGTAVAPFRLVEVD